MATGFDQELVDIKSASVSITTYAIDVQTPRIADDIGRFLSVLTSIAR